MPNVCVLLTNLIKELADQGFIQEAIDINDILYKVTLKINTNEGKDKSQDTNDSSVAANLIGLQEDGTIQNMNQGYTLEPFFSNYGDLE